MYKSKLDLMQTEHAIKFLKATFEGELASALNLTRISAPLFVTRESGLNDNLNGVERPVSFDVKATGDTVEVVNHQTGETESSQKTQGAQEAQDLPEPSDAQNTQEAITVPVVPEGGSDRSGAESELL